MTTALLIVIVLAALILAGILGVVLWGIRTQHWDRGVTIVRRRRSRRPRA